jgi:hypothetical protein
MEILTECIEFLLNGLAAIILFTCWRLLLTYLLLYIPQSIIDNKKIN